MDNFTVDVRLIPQDNQRLANLCGQYNEHLKLLENILKITIYNRGHHFQISGAKEPVKKTEVIITELYNLAKSTQISQEMIHLITHGEHMINNKEPIKNIVFHMRIGEIQGRTDNQQRYLLNIRDNDINFAIGPAGTGKTYLAVAAAVHALDQGSVQRVILVRPAVEAGEKLGFLPGGFAEKVDPYLRPLYDALFEMMGSDRVGKLLEQNVIEIAPLAYMRGRTLNDSFIILDEAQNTTLEQMKMFLTRIGFGSKAVITGDITQIDLPRPKKSGLIDAMEILKDINGICFSHFGSKDAVRHALVQRIIEAYEAHAKLEKQKLKGQQDSE